MATRARITHHTSWIAALVSVFTLLISCATNVSPSPQPTPGWLAVDDFLYQLQRARPNRIGETGYDLVIVSISAAGNSPEVIPALKHSPGGEKIVLCYMSIGQAEEYRSYWRPEWDDDPPAWLDEPDPDWTGDYWVKFWDPDWQRIIYGEPDAYLDRLIALGCDGVYLDRIDAYEYYAEQGRETAAREMAVQPLCNFQQVGFSFCLNDKC